MAQLTIQQTFDLAVRHHQAGRLGEAEQLCRQILTQQPKFPEAHCQLGNILNDKGQFDDAVAAFGKAIALRPDYPQAHYNLGNALKKKGQLNDAIAAFQQAIALNPNIPEAHNNLGNALKDNGQFDEAIVALRQAIALRPNFASAHYNLGNSLAAKRQLDEAIAAFRQAIALKPNHADAHYNLGIALRDKGQLDEAIAAYHQAIALNPKFPQACNNLGNALKDVGQLDEATSAYRQGIALDPGNAPRDGNLVYSLHFHPDYDSRALAQELRRWNNLHAQPLRKFIQPHSNDRGPDRRLRIGYVSPDLRDHVVGRNLLPLFQHHDRRQFEVTCYSHVQRPDAMTNQFQEKTDRWHNIVNQSDEQLAKQIREDQIDILVDLALHMSKNRLLVFARKPAPVQATFAGYPGSTGLETIDYRLTDLYLDPPGLNDQFYSEKSFRLPHTFWCYVPLGADVPINALPAQSHGHITFGCLSNFCKVNEPVLQLWAQVLKSVDRSRMLILAPEGSHRQRVTNLLQRDGITPDRIEFVTQRPRVPYLELYHRIDVGLDTFPYNGHSTSLDSFWMGVPVITLVGKTVVGRAGFSQLTNLGLTELIANTPQEYVRLATELAGDLPRLAELRRTLRLRMQASPLMDAAGFARDIEAAYRQMWRSWCKMAV